MLGGKLLVKGASELAATLNVSRLTIGLTVVAFGTSAPEIATCISAALKGESALLMGNIIGSNIFNTLFILGLVATISPIKIEKKLIRFDIPIMIGISLLLWGFAFNGVIDRWAGIILFASVIIYTLFAIKMTRSNQKERANLPLYLQITFIIVGLALLSLGGYWLVTGATNLAIKLQISSLLIGLTIVAIGTSLPELATSLMAIAQREPEIAVGNVIGSNLFNLLAAVGLAAIVSPGGITVPTSVIYFDIPVMVAAVLATAPIMITGHIIARWEGIVLLTYYIFYLSYLVSDIYYPSNLALFSNAFFLFILPITILVFIISLFRHYKK